MMGYLPIQNSVNENQNFENKQVNENLNQQKNSEELDPNSFFNYTDTQSGLADQLKNQLSNVDTSKIQDNPYDTTTIKDTNNNTFVEESREEAVERIRRNNEKLLQKNNQNKPKEDLNGKDDELLFGRNKKQQEIQEEQDTQINIPTNSYLDGIMSTFKNNYDVKINIPLNEKIVNPSFLKMISENINGDVVEWYTNKILKKIFKDKDGLKKLIYNEIYYNIHEEYPIEEVEEEIEEIEEKDVIVEKSNSNHEKEDLKGEEIDGIFYFEGQKTKSGNKRYKFINEKGEVKDYIFKTAIKKGYKPAKKEDLINE
jgi:hypothetical protein